MHRRAEKDARVPVKGASSAPHLGSSRARKAGVATRSHGSAQRTRTERGGPLRTAFAKPLSFHVKVKRIPRTHMADRGAAGPALLLHSRHSDTGSYAGSYAGPYAGSYAECDTESYSGPYTEFPTAVSRHGARSPSGLGVAGTALASGLDPGAPSTLCASPPSSCPAPPPPAPRAQHLFLLLVPSVSPFLRPI
ncbi:unnamed protein product [Lampetra fluviatilis]